jgi:hypothetical protein
MVAFNAEDAEAVRTQRFHFPHVRLHHGKVTVMQRPEDYHDVVCQRRGQSVGWARTVWNFIETIETGPETVHFGAQFTRRRGNGGAIGSCRCWLIVTKRERRWVIQARSSWAELV